MLVYLAACYLLVKVCAVPYQCLAITVHMSFAQAATNPVECSQKLSVDSGGPLHKRAPKPQELCCTGISGHVFKAGAMTGSLPETFMSTSQ